jgi:hypothetical protein
VQEAIFKQEYLKNKNKNKQDTSIF